MDLNLAPTFANLWSILWPILILAVIWIVIRFVFRLAMRVMVSGCLVLLLLAAGLFVFRFLAH